MRLLSKNRLESWVPQDRLPGYLVSFALKLTISQYTNGKRVCCSVTYLQPSGLRQCSEMKCYAPKCNASPAQRSESVILKSWVNTLTNSSCVFRKPVEFDEIIECAVSDEFEGIMSPLKHPPLLNLISLMNLIRLTMDNIGFTNMISILHIRLTGSNHINPNTRRFLTTQVSSVAQHKSQLFSSNSKLRNKFEKLRTLRHCYTCKPIY